MSLWIAALTVVAALGSGLVAGVFFAFSAFVMTALVRLPAGQGIAAMQSINLAVINPLFLGTFLGTAVVCITLAAASVWHWQQDPAPFLLLGSALYLVGSLAVTLFANVPRNEALALLDATGATAAGEWTRYAAEWTRWNHVRAFASLAAAAAFILGGRE